jgi:hypothetical protein
MNPPFFSPWSLLVFSDAREGSGPGSHGPGGSSSRQGQQAEAAGSGGNLIGAWRVLPNFKFARAGTGEVRFMNKRLALAMASSNARRHGSNTEKGRVTLPSLPSWGFEQSS